MVFHGVDPWNECASIISHQIYNFAQLETWKSFTFSIKPKMIPRVPNAVKTRIKRSFTLRNGGVEPLRCKDQQWNKETPKILEDCSGGFERFSVWREKKSSANGAVRGY